MIESHCPCCLNKIQSSKFISYNKIKYSVCSNCKTSYQDPILNLNYENTKWEKLNDPDGKVRNLKAEKNFKIKNWYGDSINYLNRKEGGKILDIGCGLGYFLSALDDQWEKFGLETSDDSINFIKKNFEHLDVYKGTLENNDLNKQIKFDVIFFYHVIEHLEKPLQALDTISSMLKKNGLLILGTPNNSSICSKIFKNRFRLLGPEHIFLTNHKQMKKILINKNFNIEKEEFPFFKTEYFTLTNFLKLFMFNSISPPFYGNIMTFYARKK